MKKTVLLHFSVVEGRRCASCDSLLRDRYASFKVEDSEEIVRLCAPCTDAIDGVLRKRKERVES